MRRAFTLLLLLSTTFGWQKQQHQHFQTIDFETASNDWAARSDSSDRAFSPESGRCVFLSPVVFVFVSREGVYFFRWLYLYLFSHEIPSQGGVYFYCWLYLYLYYHEIPVHIPTVQ